MKFGDLIEIVGDQPFFDLATAVQISGEARSTLLTQLHRWTRAGKLLSLRRGMYALAEPYRRVPVDPAHLANHLYRPSYLSGVWALGFYGLIPERVVTYTSVTPRVPRRFHNVFGDFEYRNVKQSAFFGYRVAEIGLQKILLAEPEKALLDLWHLGKGEWTEDRMLEMRFQNQELIDADALTAYSERFDSPRLLRAVRIWGELQGVETEGAIEL
jgi:predicted transcriptional regulator of viral defense system